MTASFPPSRPPEAARRLWRSTAFVRGSMGAAAPGILGLVEPATSVAATVAQPAFWLAATAGTAFLMGALVLGRQPRSTAVLLWIGVVAVAALAHRTLIESPALSLLLVLAGAGAALGLREGPAQDRLAPADSAAWTARGAAYASTGLWVLATARGLSDTPAILALGATTLVAIALALSWLIRFGERHRVRRGLLLAAGLVAAASLPFLIGRWVRFFGVLAVLPAVALLTLPPGARRRDEVVSWMNLLLTHPPRLLVATFAGLSAIGTLVLSLPFSSATAQAIAPIDALFTAVSAVCVNGLIVLDTPVDFGLGGHLVILILVQLGALGIMTFSTAAIALLGRRMSLSHEGAVAGLIASTERGQVTDTVKRILLVTVVSEAAGAVCLWLLFWSHGLPPLEALGKGIFTAVSAFCNAGFALDSDSLTAYVQHPGIVTTVSFLIILGGLSPLLVLRLPSVLQGHHARVQEKLVLATTVILLVVGTVLFAAFEWNASLNDLSIIDKVLNAWLQSATLRSAGFNTVDLGQMEPATLVFSLLWMFIGGSPGSVAGGIKTTTTALLLLAVLATVRGHATVDVFHRRIPHSTVYRAAAIATGGAAAVFVAFLAILLTQQMAPSVALFEVVSALGTVGLSIGGTDRLDEFGKLIIAVCMFAGRLGPLTLFVFLIRRSSRSPFGRPEEEVDVG